MDFWPHARQAASSSQIAKRAGITWGVVQHHFSGKEEVLEEILQRAYVKFHDTLSASSCTTGKPGRRVAKYVDAA